MRILEHRITRVIVCEYVCLRVSVRLCVCGYPHIFHVYLLKLTDKQRVYAIVRYIRQTFTMSQDSKANRLAQICLNISAST